MKKKMIVFQSVRRLVENISNFNFITLLFDILRFYLGNADENSCLLRGCCWQPTTPEIPGCYIPKHESKCANILDENKIDCSSK